MAKKELIVNRNSKYQFAKIHQLVNLWVENHYKMQVVLVIYECSQAFATIPMLNIVKRDDFSSYLMAVTSDICFMEFKNLSEATEFILMFKSNQLTYGVYDQGNLIISNAMKHKE